LRLERRYVQSDVELNNYSTWLYDTPIFRHWFYAAISLVNGWLLLLRRQPADIAMAALQLAGLAFAASFFIVSIACDYRYLYFTDLAAIAGLIYLAVTRPGRGEGLRRRHDLAAATPAIDAARPVSGRSLLRLRLPMRHLGHGVLAGGAELVGVVAQAHHRLTALLAVAQGLCVGGAGLPHRLAGGLHVRLLSPAGGLGIGGAGGGKRGGDNQNP